jgi:hypothetical protein
MNAFRFNILGTFESWLEADELERRLFVALCGEDKKKGSGTIDFEECSVDQICPYDDSVLEYRIFDVDGTNLEEHAVCLKCGYGSPALR